MFPQPRRSAGYSPLVLSPSRGRSVLLRRAREHPEVRRILFSRIPVGVFVIDDAVHAVVAKPVDQAMLLAAVCGK